MKMLLSMIATLLLVNQSAFAVITKKCPAVMKFSVEDMEKRSYSSVRSEANNQDYADHTSLEYFYKNDVTFEQVLVLQSIYKSECHYVSATGANVSASGHFRHADHDAQFVMEMNWETDDKDQLSYEFISRLPDFAKEDGMYDLDGIYTTISITGSNQVWDESFKTWITVAGAKFNVQSLMPQEAGEPRQEIVAQCADFRTGEMMAEALLDNESLIDGLSDPGAIELIKWAIDKVVIQDIAPEADCDKRTIAFDNLRRFMRDINERYSYPKFPNAEKNWILGVINALDKSGHRLWIINNAVY